MKDILLYCNDLMFIALANDLTKIELISLLYSYGETLTGSQLSFFKEQIFTFNYFVDLIRSIEK